MSKKINLKTLVMPTKVLNYSAGDILRKVRQNQELQRMSQSYGLITKGVVDCTQIEGGFGWAISDYIEFGFTYTERPTFTWGLDGTADIDWSAGDNIYSKELPTSLASVTTDNYQPAIFIPRIIHWHIENMMFLGCYLLISQINPDCTELNKTVRIHFLFTGDGH
jgi:hypothetical protein